LQGSFDKGPQTVLNGLQVSLDVACKRLQTVCSLLWKRANKRFQTVCELVWTVARKWFQTACKLALVVNSLQPASGTGQQAVLNGLQVSLDVAGDLF